MLTIIGKLVTFAFLCYWHAVRSQTAVGVCPSGGAIFALGISDTGKQDVINRHNDYRLQIAIGNVTGQPKGTNLLRQIYDDLLGTEGRPVSMQCKMNHTIAKDTRWSWVGQNLFIEWSSSYTPTQNWYKAVDSWFSENKNFIYPNQTTGGQIGHYTQLVWANSQYVGCDFVAYNDTDPNYAAYPYAKLYTCNYGPGGNIGGQAPYSIDTSGQQCPNLC